MSGAGFAPGKVILLGEHAVVFGQPALAAALPFGITMHAEARDSGGIRIAGAPADPRVAQAAEAIGQAVGVAHAQVQVASELPPGGGLGSSAAFAVALARALAELGGRQLACEEVDRIALESERIFHGRPSGVDHSTCARGGIVRFWKGPPARIEAVRAARPLRLVVGLTGLVRQTRTHVASLGERLQQDPARYGPAIERLGQLALGGAEDVETGRLSQLGARMDEAHRLLRQLEVSCAELDAIVDAAKGAGALGAKMTGAGGGGAAVALVEDAGPVVEAIRARGFEARVAEVG